MRPFLVQQPGFHKRARALNERHGANMGIAWGNDQWGWWKLLTARCKLIVTILSRISLVIAIFAIPISTERNGHVWVEEEGLGPGHFESVGRKGRFAEPVELNTEGCMGVFAAVVQYQGLIGGGGGGDNSAGGTLTGLSSGSVVVMAWRLGQGKASCSMQSLVVPLALAEQVDQWTEDVILVMHDW